MVSVYLKDLSNLPRPDSWFDVAGRDAFFRHPAILALGWPDDVIRQWLWEHGTYEPFLRDYGTVDLSRVAWSCESVPVEKLDTIQTGPSEPDLIERYAVLHEYSLKVRDHQPGIADAWANEGSWLVPPILVSRVVLQPSSEGLQVVEGRTRVGVLQGRRRSGLFVADHHKAWVGRPCDE